MQNHIEDKEIIKNDWLTRKDIKKLFWIIMAFACMFVIHFSPAVEGLELEAKRP